MSLQQHQKWTNSRRNVSVIDIVMLKDHNAMRNHWQLARVVAVYLSSNDCVREVHSALGKKLNSISLKDQF